MKTARQYARMICDYLKGLPDKYADDPKSVQQALGLSDADFKAAVDWCVERKIIVIEKTTAEPLPVRPQLSTAEVAAVSA